MKKHACGATDVIGIAMRDAEVVELANSECPVRGRHDAATDVERAALHTTGVHGERPPVRELHDGGIALADVEKRHAESSPVEGRTTGAETIQQRATLPAGRQSRADRPTTRRPASE